MLDGSPMHWMVPHCAKWHLSMLESMPVTLDGIMVYWANPGMLDRTPGNWTNPSILE